MNIRNHPSNQLLIDLINCKSITPKDAGCQDIIKKRLQSIGFICEELNYGEVKNLWATIGNTNGPTLCFAGHTDVVPPGPLNEWKFDPFQATFANNSIYGRGAADMKSGLAAMVIAAEQFIDSEHHFFGRLAFLITSDEEGPAVNGTLMVVEELKERKEKIDWCIVGEPSSKEFLGDTVRVGRRGSLTGYLTVKGVQGHVAYPQLANNPIRLASPLISMLLSETWDKGSDLFPPTSFEIVNIMTNSDAINVIPGEIKIIFNLRYNPNWNYEKIKLHINNLLTSETLDFDLTWRESGKPYYTEQGYLTDIVKNVILDYCGTEPLLSTDGGTSDGRFIAPMGCQVIELGALNATIHKVNESVSIDGTPELSNIYLNIMKRLFIS
ncbi:succinyl-diaminopimelate desuccinylase [Woeseiaceae bacterium]|nr:succinyl-diaminopimelate desuccinylase [Woeseiaceae bacterium]